METERRRPSISPRKKLTNSIFRSEINSFTSETFLKESIFPPKIHQ